MENPESSSSFWDRWLLEPSGWPPSVSSEPAPAAASGRRTRTKTEIKHTVHKHTQKRGLIYCPPPPPLILPLLPSVSDATALGPLAELGTARSKARYISD